MIEVVLPCLAAGVFSLLCAGLELYLYKRSSWRKRWIGVIPQVIALVGNAVIMLGLALWALNTSPH